MKRILAILLLWLPFSIAAVVAIPYLLWGLLTNNESIWKPVGRAMDIQPARRQLQEAHRLACADRALDMYQPARPVRGGRGALQEGMIDAST